MPSIIKKIVMPNKTVKLYYAAQTANPLYLSYYGIDYYCILVPV